MAFQNNVENLYSIFALRSEVARFHQGNYFVYTVTDNITATGATQATGVVLSTQYNFVTTAAAGTGVVLPLLSANLVGITVVVSNGGANSLNVYPALGQTITGLAVNTPYALVSTFSTQFIAISATAWRRVLPSI